MNITSRTISLVANMDLWRRLLDAAAKHEVEWRWLRGHAGDVMNERADRLATQARESAVVRMSSIS